MSQAQPSTSAARPLASAEAWTIAPEVHLGLAGRLREAWRYRRILLFFATKAVQSLYRNTKLGAGWLVLRPIAPVIVGSLVFGEVIGVPSDGTPYFLFFLTGSIIWGFFAEPLTRASRAIDVNRNLLTKLYLPRMILPAGQLAAGLVEPLVLLGLFACVVWYYRWTQGVWYGVVPGRLPAAALSALLAIALAFAVSLWTSVWQARARDVRYVIGYTLGFWMFLTPVVYPLAKVPPGIRWVAALNPMTGPVETFRWALIGAGAPAWSHLIVTVAVLVVVLAGGIAFFGRTEGATIDRL